MKAKVDVILAGLIGAIYHVEQKVSSNEFRKVMIKRLVKRPTLLKHSKKITAAQVPTIVN